MGISSQTKKQECDLGTKWVFRNKMNEQGKVVRKKENWYVTVTHRKKE